MKIVQKYGGSSLADPMCVKRVAERIARDAINNQMLVVVSAQGKTTDSLTQYYQEFSDAIPSRESDAALVCGEQISASLLTATLQANGVDAISMNAAQIPILAKGSHGDGQIKRIGTRRIQKAWKKGKIVIATGFQGIDRQGNFLTLGRGGSDTSAVALAIALKADQCHIFTDVDGVYSADPSKISDAVRFDFLSTETMWDLAMGGAKVLHPRAAYLAMCHRVPLEVRSTFTERRGTVISTDAPRQKGITVQSCDSTHCEITITFSDEDNKNLLYRIFDTVKDHACPIQYSKRKLCITVPKETVEDYLRKLHETLYPCAQ